MKQLLVILLGIAVVLGCRKDKEEQTQGFNFQAAAGLWVPYEFRAEDSTVFTGPFTAMSIFEAYDESVKINADGSFEPLAYIDSANLMFSDDAKGVMTYEPSGNKLFFHNSWHLETHIKKFEGNELWLYMPVHHGMYLFRRK